MRADWLVDIEEEGLSRDREKVEELIGRVFRTATGKELAKRLCLV